MYIRPALFVLGRTAQLVEVSQHSNFFSGVGLCREYMDGWMDGWMVVVSSTYVRTVVQHAVDAFRRRGRNKNRCLYHTHSSLVDERRKGVVRTRHRRAHLFIVFVYFWFVRHRNGPRRMNH